MPQVIRQVLHATHTDGDDTVRIWLEHDRLHGSYLVLGEQSNGDVYALTNGPVSSGEALRIYNQARTQAGLEPVDPDAEVRHV